MPRSVLLWLGIEVHGGIVRLGFLIPLPTPKHKEPQHKRDECQTNHSDHDADYNWYGVSGVGRLSSVGHSGVTRCRRIR